MTEIGEPDLEPTCEGCGKKIDPTVCWCGSDEKAHYWGDGHMFIPIGCDCFRSKE